MKFAIQNFPIVLVGHNVWIGNEVGLKNGVIIGHGAVIEDGTVVTKHVPPYAIVAGSPSKVIGMRYTAEQRQRMDKLKWWRYDWQNVPLNWCDVNACLDSMEQALEQQDSEKPKIPEICFSFKITHQKASKIDIEKDAMTWDRAAMRIHNSSDLYEILALPDLQPHVLKI